MNETITTITAKIELVKQLFQESRERVKQLKIEVERERKECDIFGWYDDCGEFYRDSYKEAKIKLKCAVDERIRLEKTMRYLKHRLRELTD